MLYMDVYVITCLWVCNYTLNFAPSSSVFTAFVFVCSLSAFARLRVRALCRFTALQLCNYYTATHNVLSITACVRACLVGAAFVCIYSLAVVAVFTYLRPLAVSATHSFTCIHVHHQLYLITHRCQAQRKQTAAQTMNKRTDGWMMDATAGSCGKRGSLFESDGYAWS